MSGILKIGILGGAFDPPHIAHSIVADNVREQLRLDRIIFIPSGNPPLKESISRIHRLAMAKLAFGNDDNFEVSDIEIINPDEKSYTVNTITGLKEIYKNDNPEFYLIIGLDNLIDFPKWKDPEKLFELANIIVMNRPGYSIENTVKDYRAKAKFISIPELDISSSEIRRKISLGQSVKYLVCREVLEYIKENNLYRM